MIYFQHFSDKILKFWSKNGQFYKTLANWKKKPSKSEKMGRSGR